MSDKDTVEKLEERAERLEHMAEQQQELALEAEELAEKEMEEAQELREEADRLRDDRGHGRPEDRKVEITMVVNGTPAEIEARERETLAEVRYTALEETKNLGQPPENWEIKDEAGKLLDPEKKVGEYHFGEKVTLFLSLKAGAAGV